MLLPGFDTNVFINCPFDDEYKQLRNAIIFTVVRCGFTPQLALQEANANEPRIIKLARLIGGSRLGIHDLSRIALDPATNTPRFNMPFELGLDMGISMHPGRSVQRTKKSLILASAQYQYQVFLSDIAGQDIRSHQNKPTLAIHAVRDFLEMNRGRDMTHALAGPTQVIADYKIFKSQLPKICAELQQHPRDITTKEMIATIVRWVVAQA